MSDTDSFIDEVSEEVRRDRLYGQMRRYGWIAVLAVILIVGGAAWREYAKAQAQASAQEFGDAILVALEEQDPDARIAALGAIAAPGIEGQTVLDLLIASEQVADGDAEAATALLTDISTRMDVPSIYRQIAQLKALSNEDADVSLEERRSGLLALASPGAPLALLATEQLALLDIAAGETEAALERLQGIAQDSEATSGLRRRAQQLIVALGGTIDEN